MSSSTGVSSLNSDEEQKGKSVEFSSPKPTITEDALFQKHSAQKPLATLAAQKTLDGPEENIENNTDFIKHFFKKMKDKTVNKPLGYKGKVTSLMAHLDAKQKAKKQMWLSKSNSESSSDDTEEDPPILNGYKNFKPNHIGQPTFVPASQISVQTDMISK